MARGEAARRPEDHRHAKRPFKEAFLIIEPGLAHNVAMVGGEDEDGVLCQPGLFKNPANLGDLAVDIVDRGVIAVPRLPQHVVGDIGLADQMMLVKPFAVRVARPGRDRRDGWKVDFVIAVIVAEFRARHIGVVRRGKGNCQHEGRGGLVPRPVIEPTDGVACHIVIIIDLHGPKAGPGLHHILHVLKPHLASGSAQFGVHEKSDG